MASYGSYTFNDPQPFVGVTDTPIFSTGVLDHQSVKVSLVGFLTGNNIGHIYNEKEALVSAFSTPFLELQYGTGSLNYCKPIDISFSQSQNNQRLGYDIQLEAYSEHSFSQFFGVTDFKDEWDISEEDNKIITATHVVSAKGTKISAENPLTNAMTFVSGRLANGTIPTFYVTGRNPILVSKKENINDFANSYSISETYKLNQSEKRYRDDVLINSAVKIAHSKTNGLRVSVDGSILGPISGNSSWQEVSTGMFTAENARTEAQNALERSKTHFESGAYGALSKLPKTASYTKDPRENSIKFNFQFSEPSDSEDITVSNFYNTVIQASKDNGVINVSVNGVLKYDSCFDFFTGVVASENQKRYRDVSGAFNRFSAYPLAAENYSKFLDLDIYEDTQPLSKKVRSSSIKRDPSNAEISYSFSYDNSTDYTDNDLNNASFQMTDKVPIEKWSIKESISSFSEQKTHNRTLGERSIAARSDDSTGTNNANLLLLSKYASSFTEDLEVTKETFSANSDGISVNINTIY